ncbi:MAG: hypothetical protein KKA62_01855 [Nanoarchaeota archaeon]|nr:hypothetical protein [Nanoarchaeota archaeon]MBU1643826.1 hypothetical protein [Nanoarchaeota archaeon]MBU1976678.1 hypothetical protein [Nanoarchaeota archaeon]
MKITIDTQTDTLEDIKKVVHVLSNMLERKGESLKVTETEPIDTTPMMGMFADNSEEQTDTPPDFSSFLNLAENEEVKKEEKSPPKIEFF